jgi:hypothetical protein
LTYNVLAEQGSDFTVKTIQGTPSDIAMDAYGSKIYAAFQASPPATNTFSRIDPLTGTLEASVSLSGTPSRFVLTDDGRFAFVVLGGGFSQTVAQVDLSSMSVINTILVDAPTGWNYIDGISMAPGTTDRFALIVRNANFSGIEVYQGGAKAGALALSSGNAASSVVWTDSTKLYYYSEISDTLYQATFTGSTLPVESTLPGFTHL